MGKNLVIRLHVYLMCFLLVFASPYTYALSGNPLTFTGVVNAAKTAAGFKGDYVFKDYAGTLYTSKGHVVSNADMAKEWRKNWVSSSPYGAAATAAIAGLLAAADWVLDPANNTIQRRKPVESGGNFEFTSIAPPGAACIGRSAISLVHKCLDDFAAAYGVSYMPIGVTGQLAAIMDALPVGGTHVAYDFFKGSNGNWYGNLEIKKLGTVTETVENATDDDIAEAIAKADVATQQALATPSHAGDTDHAPTKAAAAAATKTDAPPKDKECPSGQVPDSSGQCKAWESKCPNGQVYDPVKKKCVAPKLDLDDDDEWPEFCEWASPVCYYIEWAMDQKPKTDKDDEWPKFCDWAEPVCDFIEEYKTKKDQDLPEFCDWAKPVCDFIDWVKKSPDDTEPLPVDVEDTADDAQSITSQILTLGYVSGGVRSCPSDLDLSFDFMGQSIGFELSYEPLCDMLLTARPVVIAIAYFQAAKIVFVGRRD